MKRILLGKTGASVSQFCLGCMLMGTAVDDKTSFRILDHFKDAGGNFLDTANCYAWWMGKGEFIGDESENIIGKWIKERGNRSEILIGTKVGARLKDPHNIRGADGVPEWDRVPKEYEGLSAPAIRRGVEGSLKRLGTDYIDLYYTHVYDANTPLEETLETLNALVKEGKVRYTGCSNIATGEIIRSNGICKNNDWPLYSVMQQEYSYLHPAPGLDAGIVIHGDNEMFDCAEESGMAFLAYSPLLKGIYGDKVKRANYYNWHLFDSKKNLKKLELVEKISKELGITGNQLVLAWMLRRRPQIIPLLGFSKKEQYLENVAAANIRLYRENMAMLDSIV
jgi:aryl-alcohol dehydrogenase-like predicted oxidoreductase